MQQEQLQQIIELHQEWLNTEGKSGRQAELSNADLRLVNLSGINLKGAILIGTNLERAELAKCVLIGADLRKANLSYANLEEVDLSQSNLSNCRAEGTNFEGAKLFSSVLDRGVFKKAIFRKTDMTFSQGTFSWFNLCDMTQANLDRACFDKSCFKNANFTNTSLKCTSLRESILQDARGLWFDETILIDKTSVSGAMRPEYEFSDEKSTLELSEIRRMEELSKLTSIQQKIGQIFFLISFLSLTMTVVTLINNMLDYFIGFSFMVFQNASAFMWGMTSASAAFIGIAIGTLRYKLGSENTTHLLAQRVVVSGCEQIILPEVKEE
jgi:uncharacterized protein YjbI with pentapeptide repeats